MPPSIPAFKPSNRFSVTNDSVASSQVSRRANFQSSCLYTSSMPISLIPEIFLREIRWPVSKVWMVAHGTSLLEIHLKNFTILFW